MVIKLKDHINKSNIKLKRENIRKFLIEFIKGN